MTLTGERDGQAAGFWLKTIDLAPDLSVPPLLHGGRPRRRVVDRLRGSARVHGAGWLRGGAQHRRRRSRAVDAAPLEAGLIDEATFVAQGITGTWQTVDALRFIVEDLGVQPDLLLLGTSFPDAVSHQFLGFRRVRCRGAVATPVEGGDGEGVVAIDADEVEGSFATAT